MTASFFPDLGDEDEDSEAFFKAKPKKNDEPRKMPTKKREKKPLPEIRPVERIR